MEVELKENKDNEASKQINAEEAIRTRPTIIMIFFILIGSILILAGADQSHGELLITSGIVLIVATILWYVIFSPLLIVIANISKNLREINRKLK